MVAISGPAVELQPINVGSGDQETLCEPDVWAFAEWCHGNNG